MNDVGLLVCPACRGPLVPAPDALACGGCPARWPIRDGLPSFVENQELGGVEWMMHFIYDWFAPLHDPAVDYLLPVLQGTSVIEARDAYIGRVELGRLAAEVAGRPARILDVGVGTGSDLPYLERHLPPELPVEIWGLDFSAGMLALCRKRLASHRGRPMRIVHGDAHALPFADATFDRVLHVGGIAGYRAPARALAEMARVARPGTPIVVVDEQLDANANVGWLRTLAFRAVTFYDPTPHAPRECVPANAYDVLTEQVSPFYYCLRFRAGPRSA